MLKAGHHHHPDSSFVLVTDVAVHNKPDDSHNEQCAAILDDASSVLREDQKTARYYRYQHCLPGQHPRLHQPLTVSSLPSHYEFQHTITASAFPGSESTNQSSQLNHPEGQLKLHVFLIHLCNASNGAKSLAKGTGVGNYI